MRHVRLTIMAALLLAASVAGCQGRAAAQVTLSAADFAATPRQTRAVQLARGTDLTVSLVADDPAYAWTVSPAGGVLKEIDHGYVFPKAAGTPVRQRWTYRALTPGTTTLTYDYSACGAMCAPYPPADPNEGAARSLTLEVVVE